jgi:hypothetical protein
MRKDLNWDSYYGTGDPTAIAAFEEFSGFKLPEMYKEIVGRYNGATVEPEAFKFHSMLTNDDLIGACGMFLTFGDHAQLQTESVLRKFSDESLELTKGLVPFASPGNGDYLCFDYRRSDVPEVVLWHHEAYNTISPIASDFGTFLDSLFDDEIDNEG